jgi:hypothetical protein
MPVVDPIHELVKEIEHCQRKLLEADDRTEIQALEADILAARQELEDLQTKGDANPDETPQAANTTLETPNAEDTQHELPF